MRVLLDANLLISYLLSSGRLGIVSRLVAAAVAGTYTLILPDDLVTEFSQAIARKRYLADRITSAQAEGFVRTLQAIGQVIPRLSDPVPAVVRDPKDDYLVRCVIAARADYLVTGDEDLLVLGQVNGARIIRPRDFVALLEPRGLLPPAT